MQEIFMGQAHKKSISLLPELITATRETGKCSFTDKEVCFGEYIAATVGMFVHHHIQIVSMLHARFLARYWGCAGDCFCPHLQGACRFKS